MMALAQVADITGGHLHGHDRQFQGVTIDSRAVEKGNLFVAIPGDKFDGHDFLSQVQQSGAAGALVSQNTDMDFPLVRVKDTTVALGQIAAHWRRHFDLPMIAITGSNGKTSVTAMIASIFGLIASCLAPQKSFNNQWGVPLTLLQLNHQHRFAVLEMGTNHPGEIEYLTRIVKPTIALINNVSSAHLEGLGDVNKIARAKAEIYSGLNDRGIAVINADDDFAHQWMSDARSVISNGRIVTFAMENSAEVTVSDVVYGDVYSEFNLHIDNDIENVRLPMPGKHNVMNALAACAACHAAGIGLGKIKQGLEQASAVKGRLNFLPGINGATVIDDSYNANPASIKAGIDVLRKCQGRQLLVLGAMAELGETSPSLHREVGDYAKGSGIDCLIGLSNSNNSDVRYFVDGFGEGALCFETREDLVEHLKTQLQQNTTVLVKGSRSASMELVVADILAPRCQSNAHSDSKPHSQEFG